MKPRIIVTRRWPAAVEQILTERFGAKLNTTDTPMTAAEITAAMQEYDAVLPTVSDRLPPAVFPEKPKAKLLGNFGVGFNHIHLDTARDRGIVVTNTPGVLTDCTADLTITLMLMAARRAGEGERQLRAGGWTGWCPTHMIGQKVSGKTLGIIGMGRIGRAVAARAHYGFNMKIVYYNKTPIEIDDEIRGMGARAVDTIEELLSVSDVASLHCPGGDENKNLINAASFKAMKPTAFLINTARGDVVDESALIEALEKRQIAGAGLDVYAAEPSVPARLKALENAVLLPHLGSATEETRVAMGMKVVENLTAFYDGREPPNRVI